MIKVFFLVSAILLLALPAIGQGPDDPNEGSQLTYNSPAFNLKWYGRPGKSYFIQLNEDLSTNGWYYFPEVYTATGTGGVLEQGITPENCDKLFLRLEVLSYDPYTTDTDQDDMFDADEVLNGTNPKVPAPSIVITNPPGALLLP